MLKQVVLPFRFIMRIQIFLLIFVVGFTLVGWSYGQGDEASQEDPNPYPGKVAPQGHPSLYEVNLQLQLRNSEGQLITYLEPTTMFVLNIRMVHDFLDTQANKKIIEKDGELYEVIEYEKKFGFNSSKQIAFMAMFDKNTQLLLFRHDGFLSAPGDTLYASWQIIRTIQ